jgi:hypothetical protein
LPNVLAGESKIIRHSSNSFDSLGGIWASTVYNWREECIFNVSGQRKLCQEPTPPKYIYLKSTTVYVPSSELGLSHPLSRQLVCPFPRNQGGGVHSPAGEGLGESQYRRLEKSLALCLYLCKTLCLPNFSVCLLRHLRIPPNRTLHGSI